MVKSVCTWNNYKLESGRPVGTLSGRGGAGSLWGMPPDDRTGDEITLDEVERIAI
jgi:hypothetical protein